MEFLAPIIVFIKRLINSTIKKPSTDGTSGQVLATDGAGGTYWKDSGGGSGIFIADYEVTSFEEVSDAIKAGKAIFCRLPSSDTGERFSNSIIPLRIEYHEELADGEKVYHLFKFTMFDIMDDRTCFMFAILDEHGWQFAQAPIIADFIDIDGESLSDKIADIEDQIGDSITALDGINDGLEGLV